MNRLKFWLFESRKQKCSSCCLFCEFYKECVGTEGHERKTWEKLDKLEKKILKVERKHEKLDREYRKLVDSM